MGLAEFDAESFQHSTLPKICSRCSYVFDYPEEAPWSVLDEHWRVCLSGKCDEMSQTSIPHRAVNTRSRKSPITTTTIMVSTPTHSPMPQSRKPRTPMHRATKPAKRRKKNVMDKGARKTLIENDYWAQDATSKTVGCKGCGRTIKLDKRSEYYPGLWHKHRGKCNGIKRMEGRLRKIKEDGKPRNLEKGRMKEQETLSESPLPQDDTPKVSVGELRMSAGAHMSRRGHEGDAIYDTSPPRTIAPVPTESKPLAAEQADQDEDMEDDTASWYSGSGASPRSGEYYLPRASMGGDVSSDDDQSSDDEGYWADAPFAPGRAIATTASATSGRRLYRYSTRLELATKYRATAAPVEREDEGLWSDDILQAARCLVSLSRV